MREQVVGPVYYSIGFFGLLCYYYLTRRYHLHAYYDSVNADAAVADGGAAVATADDYYHDSTDGTNFIACAAFPFASSPSVATMEIR